jgi:hypothetical protein
MVKWDRGGGQAGRGRDGEASEDTGGGARRDNKGDEDIRDGGMGGGRLVCVRWPCTVPSSVLYAVLYTGRVLFFK